MELGRGGAGHPGCSSTSITADAFSGSDGDLAAMLVVAEEVEVFSASQGGGWNCAASNGEGLSRVLATERYPWRLWSSEASFVTAPRWLRGSRPDWVSHNDPTDRSAESTGCASRRNAASWCGLHVAVLHRQSPAVDERLSSRRMMADYLL